MPYAFNPKKIHDTPLWIPTQQMTIATSVTGALAPNNGTVERYIYYLNSTATSNAYLWRYDTWTDTHDRLQSPVVIGLQSITGLIHTKNHGYYGNVLEAGASSFVLAPFNSALLVGLEVEIVSGTGVGQKRTITAVTDPYVIDTGVVTVGDSRVVGDSTKRWKMNQWVGYQVRTTHGSGIGQVRKVLYNNETTLTVGDTVLQKLESWNNTLFSGMAPYANPVASAGNQTNFSIEKATATVGTPWTVVPDSSSTFVIKGLGGLFMVTGISNSSVQYYDILSDTWTQKTSMGSLIAAGLGTDIDIRMLDRDKIFASGTATSGTSRTLVDSTLSLTKARFNNFEIHITGGTGVGQNRTVISNGVTYFEISRPWDVVPDATSTYEITGNSNAMYLMGNANATIHRYNVEFDTWHTGPDYDWGTCRNLSCKFPGQEAFGVSTGVRNLGGILTLDPVPTAGGTGYLVGDIFNITTGGSGAKGRVTAVTTGGVVTGVELYSCGTSAYTTGTGKATTASLTAGTGLTVNITSVGAVARITLSSSHNLVVGDVITLAGATEAVWNGNFPVFTCDGQTTFDIIITATANMVAAATNTATIIVDCTKSWAVNELVGRHISINTTGIAPTTQIRRILSNTANTITVASMTSAVTGTSTYIITEPEAFGRDRMYDNDMENGGGYATGGTTTTLVDSTKGWFVDQWAGFVVRIQAGTGYGSEFTVISNTANTLTFATQTFTPDDTTKYTVMSAFGNVSSGSSTTLTDTTKRWWVNMWAGKRVVITSGAGQRSEAIISSNTATTLTFSVITAPDATSTYTILAPVARAANICAVWLYGHPDAAKAGNYILCPRGATFNTIDWYDITKDRWEVAKVFSPQSEIFDAGTTYGYDGGSYFYFTVSNDFYKVYRMDVVTGRVVSVAQTPFVTGTRHAGRTMTLVASPDGGLFIFLMVNTSRLMYKALIS